MTIITRLYPCSPDGDVIDDLPTNAEIDEAIRLWPVPPHLRRLLAASQGMTDAEIVAAMPDDMEPYPESLIQRALTIPSGRPRLRVVGRER